MQSAQPGTPHVRQYQSRLFLWGSHCEGTTGPSRCLEVDGRFLTEHDDEAGSPEKTPSMYTSVKPAGMYREHVYTQGVVKVQTVDCFSHKEDKRLRTILLCNVKLRIFCFD